MIKIKKDGFTLSEVLITLAIVGVLAIMVVPGLVKNTANRASISMLQGVVGNLNNSIQNEITKNRVQLLTDTDIVKKPEDFLKSLESSKTYSDGSAFDFTSYKTLAGNPMNIKGTKCTASAMLKNGATICILKLGIDENAEGDSKNISILMDINGKNPPNISGVDLFAVLVYGETDNDTGVHVGDIGGASFITSDLSNITTTCQKALGTKSPLYCYQLLEQMGFDPDYVAKAQEKAKTDKDKGENPDTSSSEEDK